MQTEYEIWSNHLVYQSFGKRCGTGPLLCVTFEKCKYETFPAGLETNKTALVQRTDYDSLGKYVPTLTETVTFLLVSLVCQEDIVSWWERNHIFTREKI